MSNPIESACKLITNRLDAIEVEAGQLRRALENLPAGNSPEFRSPMKPRGKRSAPNRQRRQAPRGKRREQLLAAIKAKPGARPSELAAEIGIAPGQVSALLAKAREEKLVAKDGAGYVLKQ
ncbi:MAG TPA: helix-turn-helix domain-containing protein [Solirubrobacterales bacterium]|nr:helix-turn-helix domain-containing protein [Solirubrobacterales bacterium]